MNGTDNILRRIREDAQREMDAMQQEALEKREAILARGREQSDRLLAEGRQKNLQLAEGRKARLISAANMESRQVLLYNKQKYIDEVFTLAKKRIEALPWADYAEYLAQWIAHSAETGTETVILSERNREKMGQLVVQRANALRKGGAFTLASETRDIQGVILRRGSVEINGSLDYRFGLLRERLATEVAQVLFQ